MNATVLRLSHKQLGALVADLRAAGTAVIAPREVERAGRKFREYGPIEHASEMELDGPLPARSLKQHLLPVTEALFHFRTEKERVELAPAPTSFPRVVVLGARPCDAAALEIVDRVMDWDYHDELWFGRRAATSIFTAPCPGGDDACFCEDLGLGRGSARGADGMLRRTKGGYELELYTLEAQALVDRHETHFTPVPGGSSGPPRTEAATPKLDLSAMQAWIAKSFEHPLWAELAQRCHGCGACASVCPTCHCFDIVDEPTGIGRGSRRRNWDHCQSATFTRHASGHNPRPNQASRTRQRVSHKFAIYPERFQEVLCTGCGRCIRACGAGMDLRETLGRIAALASSEAAPCAQPSSGGSP